MPVVQAGDDVIEFPDSMSSEDVQSALKARYAKPESQLPVGPVGRAGNIRYRPQTLTEPSEESLIGISPNIVPRGTTPATSTLSALGKTGASLGQFLTSPKGMGETALAATDAAPAIMAKWAYDMLRGGYKSLTAIKDELGQMANEALNKNIITQNQLGPVPEGTTQQEHIQNLAENTVNALAMGLGVTAIASHGVRGDKAAPPTDKIAPGAVSSPPEALSEAQKEQAPHAVALEGAPPTAPATVKAEGEPVAAGSPEPAKVEGGTAEQPNQASSVTKDVTEKPIGMGGAEASEIPETGAGGEKSGVAERIRAERAKAGQVEPVPPGKGISTEETIALGRDIIRRDPEAGTRIMAQFEADPKKAISTEGIAVVRAHGESLAAGARTIEENYGTESTQYRAAREYLSDWDRRSKAMQTEWHKQGQAQQGETDIDTGSFTGLERARQQATGKKIPEGQKPKAKKIAADNKTAEQEVSRASEKINARIKSFKGPTMSEAEKRAFDAANRTVREANVRAAEAENKARVADAELKKAIAQVRRDAEQRAQAAADRTVRESNVRAAKAENKARTTEEIRNQAEEQVQKDAAKKAEAVTAKTVRDAATKAAEAENKARLKRAEIAKRQAELERQKAQKLLDEANRRVREEAIKGAEEERRRLGDPSIAVWELAKKYLDENKGLYGFDDLRNKIATDLKMKPSQVAYWMQKDPLTKRLADDLWNKQRNARRLKEQAKIWLRELDTPGYQKALASIPRFMFSASVFGHGFVALGTHAPIVAFQPRFWNAYVRNFGKMYKMVFSPAYYEMQMQDLVRRPNYEVARRSGLQNDPFKYEEFHTGEIKNLVKDWVGEKNMDRIDKFASAGNRGYGVLKLLRQDMFDQRWNKLPDSIRKQEGVAEGIADGVNHATGVTKKQAPQGTNILLFAPRLAGSRVMWLGGDPVRAVKAIANWKKTTEAERQFATAQLREKGWVLGTFASLLAMNQGFLSAAGSKQKINGIPEILGGAGIDPMASDFLKFKALGGDVAYGGALLTLAKLPVRVATAILYEGKGSKYILEDERVDKVIGQYIRSQMSPFAGTVSDLALGRDYEERPLPAKMFGMAEQPGAVPKRLQDIGVDEPYNWLEYTGTKLPIPAAEALKEGLRSSGMDDNQINAWLKALAVGSIMTATGTRITEDTREE